MINHEHRKQYRYVTDEELLNSDHIMIPKPNKTRARDLAEWLDKHYIRSQGDYMTKLAYDNLQEIVKILKLVGGD